MSLSDKKVIEVQRADQENRSTFAELVPLDRAIQAIYFFNEEPTFRSVVSYSDEHYSQIQSQMTYENDGQLSYSKSVVYNGDLCAGVIVNSNTMYGCFNVNISGLDTSSVSYQIDDVVLESNAELDGDTYTFFESRRLYIEDYPQRANTPVEEVVEVESEGESLSVKVSFRKSEDIVMYDNRIYIKGHLFEAESLGITGTEYRYRFYY